MVGKLAVIVAESLVLPALFAPTPDASRRYVEFFTANIRNPNTRKAYHAAAVQFAAWCEDAGLTELRDIEPVHVAAYVETLMQRLAAPSVKQHIAGVRMLFDWLVIGQLLAFNPASAVRGPKHSVRKGKTPVLTSEEARALLDAIDGTTLVGKRDRALIGLMVFTFARVGAALSMKVEDVYVQGRRLWVRLHEKGGKVHEMPCHHNLETYLHAHMEAAGSEASRSLPLPYRARPHRRAHRQADEPARCLSHDPAPRARCRHPHQDRQTLFPRHWHHRISPQRRQARSRAADGRT